MLLFVLLVSGVLAQKLILTSNENVEVSRDDGSSGSGFGPTGSSGSGGSGSSSGGKVLILGGGGGLSGLGGSGGSGDKKASVSSSGGAKFAKFSEPNAEAIALKPKNFKSSFSTDSRLQSSLASARWIVGLGFQKTVFWSECFYNSCPKGNFTLDIQATCSFTVYLID